MEVCDGLFGDSSAPESKAGYPDLRETRRALCPGRNQPANDLIMTPPSLATRIVRHFKPTGTAIDPCRGQGAFFNALVAIDDPPLDAVDWCEIVEGRDFLELDRTAHYSWAISNPPWSRLAAFLSKAMSIADNVVFLVTLTHLDTRARDRMIHLAGFGRKEALLVPHPPRPWPGSGFLLCAYHLQRNYTGGLHFDRHMMPPMTADIDLNSKGPNGGR